MPRTYLALSLLLVVTSLVACEKSQPEKPNHPPAAVVTPSEEVNGDNTGAAAPPSSPDQNQEQEGQAPEEVDEEAEKLAAWKKSFEGDDPFDAATQDDEGEEIKSATIISNLKRMDADETRTLLLELSPKIEALSRDHKVPKVDDALDSGSFLARAYPVGEHAVLILFREQSEMTEDASEHEIPKSTLLYDRTRDEIVWFQELHDWKRWENYQAFESSGTPMLWIGTSSEGGSCASGGEEIFWAVTSSGARKVLEHSWDLTTHGAGSRVAIGEDGTVTITSKPAVKKDAKKETFVVDVIQETCKLSGDKLLCDKRTIEKGLTTPGCF